MQWQVRSLNVKLSEALASYAKQKLHDPLRRFAHGIESIVLRVRDVDLSNVKSPQCATAVVRLHSGVVIALEQQDYSLYAAIDQLADRVKNTVKRRLSRRRRLRRRPARRAEPSSAD